MEVKIKIKTDVEEEIVKKRLFERFKQVLLEELNYFQISLDKLNYEFTKDGKKM